MHSSIVRISGRNTLSSQGVCVITNVEGLSFCLLGFVAMGLLSVSLIIVPILTMFLISVFVVL